MPHKRDSDPSFLVYCDTVRDSKQKLLYHMVYVNCYVVARSATLKSSALTALCL